MEAARTSETSVDIQLRTRQYIPEDSELHTRRRENFKSHILACSQVDVDRRFKGAYCLHYHEHSPEYGRSTHL
jgi:hypothetical protein